MSIQRRVNPSGNVRYRARVKWWPDAEFERDHITPQQDERFEVDAWEAEIEKFILGRNRVTVSEIARDLGIDTAKLGTADQRRIGIALSRLGWKAIRDWQGRAYVPHAATSGGHRA